MRDTICILGKHEADNVLSGSEPDCTQHEHTYRRIAKKHVNSGAGDWIGPNCIVTDTEVKRVIQARCNNRDVAKSALVRAHSLGFVDTLGAVQFQQDDPGIGSVVVGERRYYCPKPDMATQRQVPVRCCHRHESNDNKVSE
jgi:hypothetical protein